MFFGERLNAVTHLLGLGVVAIWFGALLNHVQGRLDPMAAVGVALFALSAVILYASSTAFHACSGPFKSVLERVDHGAIFLLIAGTYTPFALSTPRYGVNLVILAGLWSASLGVAWAVLTRPAVPTLVPYLVLGWTAVASAIPIALRAGTDSAAMLLLGALIYSAGTPFYLNRRGWRHAHALWHLCVLAGTVCHFAAITHLLAQPAV